MTIGTNASANLQRRRFAEASANLQPWRFADPFANRFAEASNEAVIPDLVSEERAENVGNPCRDGGDVKTGKEQPIRKAKVFEQMSA